MSEHSCPRCAGAVAAADRFCRHCGALLRQSPPDAPALHAHPDTLVLVDAEHVIRRVNTPSAARVGHERVQIEGRRLDACLPAAGGVEPAGDEPAECGFHRIAPDAYLVALSAPWDEGEEHEEGSVAVKASGAGPKPDPSPPGPIPPKRSPGQEPVPLLHALAGHAARWLTADRLAVELLDSDGAELATVAEYRSATAQTDCSLDCQGARRLRDAPFFQRVITEREPLVATPPSLLFADDSVEATGEADAVLIPLTLSDCVIGVLAARVADGQQALAIQEPMLQRGLGQPLALTLEMLRRFRAQARACQELTRLKEYYEAILDSLTSGVFVINGRGAVQFWSRSMEQMSGVARGRALRANLFEQLPYLAPYREKIQAAGRSRKPFRIERLVRQREASGPDPDFVGTQEVTETYLFQPLLRDGRLAGILGIVDDITQKIRLDQQLLRSERLAAVGELAAGVAHNFNNILAAIGGDAQLLKLAAEEHGLPEPIVETARMIYEETMRGGRIAHDLLSFARGQQPMLQVLDVATVIQDTIRLVSNHQAAKNTVIQTELRPHLPKVAVDPNQLHQVFFNIMLNALQAMPGGGTLTISARVRAADDYPDRGVLEIRFADTGVGLSPEQARRVFDPFFSSRQNGTTGTGLGLTVSLSMVKGMGGDIQFDSVPGEGTTVTVLLPIVERRAQPRSGALQRGRLLLVDDEQSVRRSLCSFLAHRGYKVDTARDGEEAVQRVEEALKNQPYEVIVMDLMLPRLDGAEAIRQVMARDPGARIIVLTGVTTQEAVHQALENGARFAFSKPVNFAELFNVVECLRLAGR